MSGQKTVEISKNEKKQKKKGWIRALIIISIFTALSLACSFIFVKMLPSNISVQIKTVTEIISLGGGIAIFYIIFKLLFSSFKEILPFVGLIIIIASMFNIFIFLNNKNRVKYYKNLEVQNETLNSRLTSTNVELNHLKKSLDVFTKYYPKIENSGLISLIVKVIEKTSSRLICEDLISRNKTLTFPLEKIQIVFGNEKTTIIKVPQELYIEAIESAHNKGDDKSNKMN